MIQPSRAFFLSTAIYVLSKSCSAYQIFTPLSARIVHESRTSLSLVQTSRKQLPTKNVRASAITPSVSSRIPKSSTRMTTSTAPYLDSVNKPEEESYRQNILPTKGKITKRLSYIFTESQTLFNASLIGAREAIRQSWWCFPMLLTLFPLYYGMICQTWLSTPSWWPMVRLDFLREHPMALLMVGGFLLSNLSYILSGLYLLDLHPFRFVSLLKRRLETADLIMMNKRRSEELVSDEVSVGVAQMVGNGLGLTVLASGIVSAIYHAVQTLGPVPIAETLCYVDHAVAISSSFYFLSVCGLPSVKTLLIGFSGLALLAMPVPSSLYAWSHSVWHMVSAATTVSWAHDGVERRRSGHASTFW